MIGISDLFSMVGVNGCSDVATSLAMQGCDPEIDIPIYEVLYLKFMCGERTKGLADTIPEYNAIRRMSICCGAVAATLTIAGLDILELAGLICIFTPNTGMNVFLKLGEILVENISSDEVQLVLEAAHIPIPDFIEEAGALVGEALDTIFNMMISTMQDELGRFGIVLHQWNELPEYYSGIKASGEMQEMYNFRQTFGAAIF